MEFDTFPSLQNLSHAARGCHDSVLSQRVKQKGKTHDDYQQTCADSTVRVYASRKTHWESGMLTVKVQWEAVGNQAAANTQWWILCVQFDCVC